MTIVKTAELIGLALDWAVQRAKHPTGPTGEGWYERDKDGLLFDPLNECTVSNSTIWDQGWPIIEERKLSPVWNELWGQWTIPHPKNAALGILGPTFLIAAMRCFIASELGDEVDVPAEFTAQTEGQAEVRRERPRAG